MENFSKNRFVDKNQVIVMERPHLTRQLKAILLADVVGYCRLMSVDEEGTHVKIADYVKDIIEPEIAEYGGRLIRSMGDGFLVEFNSAADAVCCGLDVQDKLAERNTGLDRDHQIQLRIGINTGDVIVDDRDIYGNSVNIAARLEGLAEPGEIYVTRGCPRSTARPSRPIIPGQRRPKGKEFRASDPRLSSHARCRPTTGTFLAERGCPGSFPNAVRSAPAFGHTDGQHVSGSSRGYGSGVADPARLLANVASRIDHGAALPQCQQ